jgi:hypothetical protein
MFSHSEDKIINPGQVWHGAAVAWHSDLHSAVTPLTATHERFSAINIKISSLRSILAISLYAPTSGKDDDFLECIDFLSDFLSSNISGQSCVIIGAKLF